MENQRTCGKGLAEHSALPAKMGALTAVVAENLEAHLDALDQTDASSKKEHDAYADLANGHRTIASGLEAIAKQMAGYRDLPMGRHDPQAMSAPEVRAAFERFVKLEQELLTLLQRRVEQDRQMLRHMGGSAGATR